MFLLLITLQLKKLPIKDIFLLRALHTGDPCNNGYSEICFDHSFIDWSLLDWKGWKTCV